MTTYTQLKAPFLNGHFEGQLNSVHKTRESNPVKVAEFRLAMVAGDVVFPVKLTPRQIAKLADLGITRLN